MQSTPPPRKIMMDGMGEGEPISTPHAAWCTEPDYRIHIKAPSIPAGPHSAESERAPLGGGSGQTKGLIKDLLNQLNQQPHQPNLHLLNVQSESS